MEQPPSRTRKVPWVRFIGEFVVIVSGVLVALAADSWNDSRLERQEEREYLARLHAEIAQDIANFRFILDWMDRKETGLDRLRGLFAGGTDTFDPDTVLADLTAAPNFGWNVGPLARLATFEDLRSSGKLGLIRDAELRGQIVAHYQEAESEDRRLQARRTPYPALSYQLVPFSRHGGEPDEFAETDDVLELLDKLRRSELPQYILAERNRASFTRGSIRYMLELAAALMDSISEELGGG